MIKRTLVSIAIASMLSACGGSSSSSNDSNEDTTVTTEPVVAVEPVTPVEPTAPIVPITPDTPTEPAIFRAIDGYLSNADVCVIREGATNCESIGVTDENGLITIPADITAGQVVVSIVSGQTEDLDFAGFVRESYEMIAEISADTPNVITPFTTLDVLDETRTLADIASDLNLTESLISGDYTVSTEADQAQTHLLARSIVTELSTTLDENNVVELSTQTLDFNNFITTTLLNTDADLDDVTLSLDGDLIEQGVAINELTDFLESGDLFVTSINAAQVLDEGINLATFNNGQTTFNGNVGTFEVNGNELITTSDNESETDIFLYVSSELSLSVPVVSGQDLTLISRQEIDDDFDISFPFEESDIVGQTYYFVSDDSSSSTTIPDPTIVKLVFSDSTVEITEGDAINTLPWDLTAGTLNIDLISADIGETNLFFRKSISDDNVTVIRDINEPERITLVFTEESLAQSIFTRWDALQN